MGTAARFGNYSTVTCKLEAHIDYPWHRVNWRRAKAAVRRLQTRIVKATKAGKGRLIRKLQSLLIRSTAAKLLAVRRVTSTRGKKTPGVDGVVFDTPRAKWQAMERLNSAGYRPSPLQRVYRPKPNGKKRPLGIPTMQDRAMQALYSLALDPVLETKSDPIPMFSARALNPGCEGAMLQRPGQEKPGALGAGGRY